MFKTGIVSVTFREKSIDEIIRLCAENGLSGIEVGSDIHAPCGNIEECLRIGRLARENGVEVVSYGSYYKLGQGGDMEMHIKCAKALGARNVRVWAGVKGSLDTTEDEREAVTKEAVRFASLAEHAGMTVSLEYHVRTLTDSWESALRLVYDVNSPALKLYWQPNQYKSDEYNLLSLKKVLPYVTNIHVFAWTAPEGEVVRHPLSEHGDIWKRYLDILSSDGCDRYLLLEFVMDDSVTQLVSDAEFLNRLAD